MSGLVSLALLLVAVAIGGCAPDAQQAVSIYTRNDTVDPFHLTTKTDPAFVMPVAGAGNCVRLASGSSLVVSSGEVPNEDAHAAARLDVPRAGEAVAVWVHVHADGTVEVGRGIPSWWQGQPQGCA